jgi:sporulation protein YlmC with PRC-barrel domain
MLNVEQIDEWLGQEVLDSQGESLGKLEDVYFARGQSEPQLALVKSGLLGRKHTLVPLHGATVGREHVRIAHTSEQVEEASEAVEVDYGEMISGSSAQQLGGAFGVELAADDLDSANALEQRRAAALEAEDRAAKLETEAQERAQGAGEAQASASEQSAQATEAERTAREARAEAERLRP